jgi:microcystin-dependent protein
MPSHSAITDPDIHEPKGISTAPENSVYVATGTGTGNWTVLPNTDPELVAIPVGFIMYWPSASIPTKWVTCFGQAVSRTTYSDLFSRLGTTYGVGDGSTTFNLPDLRGRFVAGWDLAGGLSGNRLTSPINGDTLGASGGTETVTLAAANVPAMVCVVDTEPNHTHTVTPGDLCRNSGNDGFTAAGNIYFSGSSTLSINSNGAHTHTGTINSGGGSAHMNIQPTMILNMIIYTGV